MMSPPAVVNVKPKILMTDQGNDLPNSGQRNKNLVQKIAVIDNPVNQEHVNFKQVHTSLNASRSRQFQQPAPMSSDRNNGTHSKTMDEAAYNQIKVTTNRQKYSNLPETPIY